MKQYRVALIGTGAVAGGHMNALRANGERVQVVAAVDINEERVQAFCEQHDIPRWYTNSDAMLEAEQPDLVHINTPPDSHYELTLKCLSAGAWVYCEKPLCGSLRDFDAIERASAESGCYVSTVFQWRFGSAARHLKKLIEQGEMGRPLVGVCNTLWYRDEIYYANEWHRNKSGYAGVTNGLGIHLMDLFLWLVGDWSAVTAKVATVERNIEVDNISLAMVQFENGTLATFTNSAVSPRQESYLRLDFEKSTVEVTALYGYTNDNWRYSLPDSATDSSNLNRWQTIEDNYSGSHTEQLRGILDSMDKNERPFLSGAEGRRIIEFITCLYKSAATGQAIRHGTIQAGDPYYDSIYG